MVDRRRASRLVFSPQAAADIRIVHDAVLEYAGDERARILTTESATPGEPYLLQFTARSGRMTTYSARVLSCTPVVRNNVVNYRLDLALVAEEHSGPALG